MFQQIVDYIFVSPQNEEEKERRASLTRVTSLVALLLTILASLPILAHLPASSPGLVLPGLLCLLYLVTFLLTHYDQVRVAGILLTSALWVIMAVATFLLGAQATLGFSALLLVIIIASLLFNHRTGLFYFALSLLVSLTVFVAEIQGVIFPIILPTSQLFVWTVQGIIFIATALLAQLAFQSLGQALSSARENEQQSHRRAVQLQVAAEVARDATAFRETEQLLTSAVDLISNRFGFYFVAIYTLDENGEYAILKAASGKTGRKLLEAGHKLKLHSTGIVAHVAGSGEPRIALNVGQDSLHLANPLLTDTRSEMSIPLKLNGRIIGVLDVQSHIETNFDEEDVAILQILADQLVVALETARLIEAAKRQLRELTVLHMIALACARATSEDDLIEQITQILGDAFYSDNFGVILLDEATGLMIKHSSYRERIAERLTPYSKGAGITGKVALEGKPMRVADTSQDPAYLEADPKTRSELCVPLKAGKNILGVINTESTQLDAFSEADERLLMTLAGQMTTAIQRVRLYQVQKQRSAEMEALRQASLQLTSSLALQPVLETILKQALTLVTGNDAHVFLFDGIKLAFGAALWAGTVQEKPFSEPRPNGLTYTVARQGRKIVVPDISKSAMFRDKSWEGAIIGLPLRVGDQVLGVMNIAFLEPHAFNADEIRILELLADQAAVALSNARLYDETQRRASDLSEALARLQQLDRLKNEFIQNISHELRTPLAIALGYAELFTSGELGELRPEQQLPMQIMLKRLRTLGKVLDDLLIILEIEARSQLSRPIDLARLTQGAIQACQETLAKKKIQLFTDIPVDLPLINGTPDHLRRVLDNLLSNAIKFTPENGEIKVHLFKRGERIALEISDTGIGVAPKNHERIFERFYQVDGRTTRRFGGTGLGLALVKEVVEAHGGGVGVTSVINQGSTFRVELPISRGAD